MNIWAFATETNLGRALVTFLIAMVPVVELRGAIPYGVIAGLPVWVSALAAICGNILPVPFIILFARRILNWMKTKSAWLQKVAGKLEEHASKKQLYRGELIGLAVFVAIPLPGTGAWTGALIAAVLGMRLKSAFPAIAIGVVVAGILISIITYGVGAVI
jgi:uncharacterized membrane protein